MKRRETVSRLTAQPAGVAASDISRSGGLRSRAWRRFLRGPDQALLEELYVPALREAVRYDRCCAYFSSSVLSAAARGFGPLIERLTAMGDAAPRPAVRLLVNEELSAEDVDALTESGDTKALEAHLRRRFKNPQQALEKARLKMLAWLVKEGLLAVRVGVMRRGEGIVHGKFGIVTDGAGDAVVFAGSGNESAQGLAGNYEQFEVSTSWEDLERHQEMTTQFELLWSDTHPDVHTVDLPEALRLRLVKLAPPKPPTQEPTDALPRQRAAMVWRFITEAPFLSGGGASCDATAMVSTWPHQRRVVEETASAWPMGRLLCDEVGLGKTVEAILVMRRLMAGRGVKRVLVLPPAGLLRQWQGELREKGGLVFPRLEGASLIWPDGSTRSNVDLAAALEEDSLILSRELARLDANVQKILAGPTWDLVLMDEAHAARRARPVEGEFNGANLLLSLLRKLQYAGKARGILLLSATPMQTQPWEPWDLLSVLGEGGEWLAEFGRVRDYYRAISAVAGGRCDQETAISAASLISSDPHFPGPDGAEAWKGGVSDIARRLRFCKSSERASVAGWMRRGSPLGRRMHRNTRDTLRHYYRMGLLDTAPPDRRVEDVRYDFTDERERHVYEGIETYIKRRFEELEKENAGKGFVMTIYRRRASSSPRALYESLNRRRRGLERVAAQQALDWDIEPEDAPDARDLPDAGVGDDVLKVSAAYPTSPDIARAELEEVNHLLRELADLGAKDSKLEQFYDQLRRVTEDGRPVLIFTEYSDTMVYLRQNLVAHYGEALGCYCGEGGEKWDGKDWKPVTKDAITRDLRDGKLRILVCTDAASEGLNLQSAGAVINYDLPWNPSKVEQRIGRIDRIGQKQKEVRVVNFFLEKSVDELVYNALRRRCGLFEHFVGPMQPVLAIARKMLLGQVPVDPDALEKAAAAVEGDALATESYLQSEAVVPGDEVAGLSMAEIEAALGMLTGEFGPTAKKDKKRSLWTVTVPGMKRAVYSGTLQELERDPRVLPLSPLDPRFKELAKGLTRAGERLPLVVESHSHGSFRRSVALWVDGAGCRPVTSMSQLTSLVNNWDGTGADASALAAAREKARKLAEAEVAAMEATAAQREREGLEQQVAAARERLKMELGRYLVTIGPGAGDPNEVLIQVLKRRGAAGQRMKQCLEKLGGYPEWSPELQARLAAFAEQLTPGQIKARQSFTELDAALQDPRWGVLEIMRERSEKWI